MIDMVKGPLSSFSKNKRKETTTIRVGVDLKKELDEIKEHPRETYEDIIRRLMGRQE